MKIPYCNKKIILPGIILAASAILWFSLAAHRAGQGRTFIIGIDGADPAVIDDLISRKKLPNFARIIENGSCNSHNVFDTTPDHITSPEIFTSLVTGVSPKRHGISENDLGNDIFFSTSENRREPAVWNIFSQFGKRVIVVNWWVSYPAEKVNGCIVSNLINEMYGAITHKPGSPVKLSASSITYPASLSGELIKFRGSKEFKYFSSIEESNIARSILGACDEKSPRFNDNAEKADWTKSPNALSIKELVSYIYSADRNSLMFTKYLLNRDKKVDLVVLYLEGIDGFSHAFWCFRKAGQCPGIKAEQAARYKDMLDNYYRLIDIYLGQILQYVNDNDTLIVCSDHGFQARGDYLQQLQKGNMFTGTHRPLGIFIIYGKNIKKHAVIDHLTLLDMLPTVLYLNRIPISIKLEGKIIFDGIKESFIKKTRPIFIESYEVSNKIRIPRKDKEGYPYREDIKARLRTLGYLN